MLNIIEKLREKPESYKVSVAFIVSASIAGIIFIVWLSVVGVRFNSQENIVSEQEGPSLVADVKTGFSKIFEEGKARIDSNKEELKFIIH